MTNLKTKKQTITKKQPIYTKLTFKQRKSVQRLLATHCPNIHWGSGTEIKENDFNGIRRHGVLRFNFEQNGLSLHVIIDKTKIELTEPKAFLKQIKEFSDDLRNNSNNSNKYCVGDNNNVIAIKALMSNPEEKEEIIKTKRR